MCFKNIISVVDQDSIHTTKIQQSILHKKGKKVVKYFFEKFSFKGPQKHKNGQYRYIRLIIPVTFVQTFSYAF